jgi:hypothetical protein
MQNRAIIKRLTRRRGEKTIDEPDQMIKVQVNFWTNGIASTDRKRIPRVAWDSGIVQVLPNDPHGIGRGRAIPFNSLSELQPKLETALMEERIKLLKSRKFSSVYYA